ncbi:MAG: M14 family metallocarboxypeptidase [Verrucomicrobiales bacterium]
MAAKLLTHSGHDFERLLSRWEALADRSGWQLNTLAEDGGFPVLVVENREAETKDAPGVYLSAGVHGDECAPVWGLLQWAEEAANREFTRPFVVFPCLNPHGLVHNIRRDHNGVDLNRKFHDPDQPLIAKWQRFLEGRRFDFSLNLHEDYDTTGIYLYELARKESIGHRLLAACEDVICREPLQEVDGRQFEYGLLKAEGKDVWNILRDELDGDCPEAIHLYLHQRAHALTFETPSEMDLSRRVETHRRLVHAAVKML